MTDYQCYPIWWHGRNLYKGEILLGCFHPNNLPLAEQTVNRLMLWQDMWDAILNKEDPQLSGFATPQDEEKFEEEGIALWHILRKELKPDYHVAYHSTKYRRVFENPEDLETEANRK